MADIKIVLTNEKIWCNDEIMSANAEAGLSFEMLVKIARAIERAVLEAQAQSSPVETKEAIRNAALEEAAKQCDECFYEVTSVGLVDIGQAIRKLKSQQEGGQHELRNNQQREDQARGAKSRVISRKQESISEGSARPP